MVLDPTSDSQQLICTCSPRLISKDERTGNGCPCRPESRIDQTDVEYTLIEDGHDRTNEAQELMLPKLAEKDIDPSDRGTVIDSIKETKYWESLIHTHGRDWPSFAEGIIASKMMQKQFHNGIWGRYPCQVESEKLIQNTLFTGAARLQYHSRFVTSGQYAEPFST